MIELPLDNEVDEDVGTFHDFATDPDDHAAVDAYAEELTAAVEAGLTP